MIYYGCSTAELEKEVRRRNFEPLGSHDALSEGLKTLDDTQGSEATTLETVKVSGTYDPMDEYGTLKWEGKKLRPARGQRPRTAFGKTFDAHLLAGEKIIYWTMNTFFPIVQLYFDSGLSCTIEGGQLAGAFVGMDNKLRARLIDLTHEENGQLFQTPLPEKFIGPNPTITIVEAQVACRTSIAVKQMAHQALSDVRHSSSRPTATIRPEEHVVIGLRLEGMKGMGYVWARVPFKSVNASQKTWGNVRIARLSEAEDVVVPFLGFPQRVAKQGGQVSIVERGSIIRDFDY